jgi:hypothetical protein
LETTRQSLPATTIFGVSLCNFENEAAGAGRQVGEDFSAREKTTKTEGENKWTAK